MMSIRSAARPGAALAAVFALSGAAASHEGHDHGPPPPPPERAAPRAAAVSQDLELVAVARAGTLTLHLDRFASNEPVAGATVAVEAPDGPRAARETEPGTYALPAPWLDAPGRHDLVVTVTAGADAEVMSLALAVPAPEAAPPAGGLGGALGRTLAPVLDGLRSRLARQDPALPATAGAAFLLGALAAAGLRGRRAGVALLVGLAATLALALGGAALAHEAAGRHGGRVADAGPFHIELVTRGPEVVVHVSDGTQKPVPAAGFRGTAILVVDGKPARVPLEPQAEDRLAGRAASDLGARPRGVVQITAPDGARASGRFE
jgi:membrane fusion protein, heavy metal efflux system